MEDDIEYMLYIVVFIVIVVVVIKFYKECLVVLKRWIEVDIINRGWEEIVGLK